MAATNWTSTSERKALSRPYLQTASDIEAFLQGVHMEKHVAVAAALVVAMSQRPQRFLGSSQCRNFEMVPHVWQFEHI